MAIPTRADVDKVIASRLAAEPGFREKLLADPRAAVSEAIGTPIPEAVKVQVHEESLTEVHLVVPAAQRGGELADADLELVAGGLCWGHCGDIPPH